MTEQLQECQLGVNDTQIRSLLSFSLTSDCLWGFLHSLESQRAEHYFITLTLKGINLPVTYGNTEGNGARTAEVHAPASGEQWDSWCHMRGATKSSWLPGAACQMPSHPLSQPKAGSTVRHQEENKPRTNVVRARHMEASWSPQGRSCWKPMTLRLQLLMSLTPHITHRL